jgi:hypothetical protein
MINRREGIVEKMVSEYLDIQAVYQIKFESQGTVKRQNFSDQRTFFPLIEKRSDKINKQTECRRSNHLNDDFKNVDYFVIRHFKERVNCVGILGYKESDRGKKSTYDNRKRFFVSDFLKYDFFFGCNMYSDKESGGGVHPPVALYGQITD